jgi:outer membrane autotransporter protein
VNGTTVTGAGTSSSAFFDGTVGLGYDVTVQSGSALTSPNGVDEIKLDNGTVTVQSGATITAAGAANTVHFTGTAANGTLINGGNIVGGGALYNVLFDGNGTVNNSGTIGPSIVVGIGFNGNFTLTNTGTIYEGVYGNAIGGNAHGGVLNITNAVGGTISSQIGGNCYGSGMQVYGASSATIVNAGTITSTAGCGSEGIGVGTLSGSLLNSGTIYGNSATGMYDLLGIDLYGGTTNMAVTNSGTITLDADLRGFGVYVGNTHDSTIRNTNLIDVNSLGTEAHGVYIDAASYNIGITNSGTILATGGSAASDGIRTLAGSNNITIENAGSITGDDYGIFIGGNTSTITTSTGSTIQGGTAAIGLAGTDNVVKVRGQSHIVGVIEGNTSSPGTPLANNKLNLYLTGLSGTQIDAFNAAILTAGTGAGTYTVGADTYSWDSFSEVNLAAFSNLRSQVDSGLGDVAGRIDGLPGNLSADFDSFYDIASNDPQSALNSLTGRQIVSAYSTMSMGSARALGELSDSRASILQNEMGGTEVKSGGGGMLSTMLLTSSIGGQQPVQSKWGAWIDNSVTFTHQDTTSDGPGYHGSIETPTIGLDYRVTPDLTIGGLAHVQVANSDFKDGSHARLEDALIGAYGVYSHDSWFANGLLGVGYNDYDNRRVALNGSTAEGSPSGEEFMATLGGGYNFKQDGWNLAPVAGLQYTYIDVDSYNEEGAGAMNLKVSNQNINSLRTKLGAQVSSNFNVSGVKLTPNAAASWYHDLLDGNNKVDESLSGAPELGEFGVESTNSDRDFATLRLGVSAKPLESTEDITFYVNYSDQMSRNFNANTVYGGVRIGF